jgi:hypothetical protein
MFCGLWGPVVIMVLLAPRHSSPASLFPPPSTASQWASLAFIMCVLFIASFISAFLTAHCYNALLSRREISN